MDPSARTHHPTTAATRPGQPVVNGAAAISPPSFPAQPHQYIPPVSHRNMHVKEYTDEKVDPSLVSSSSSTPPQRPLPHICTLSISQPGVPCSTQHCATHSSHTSSIPYSVSPRTAYSSPAYTRPRGLRIANLLKPWIPIILYALTSLGFLVAISFWKAEVFEGLDQLSHWLRSDEYTGQAVIFALIFLTTFPPVPLYSTLVILSGYTFGPWTGATISYFASLAGALTVFLLSRTFFRDCISRWLSCTVTIKRVVRAIEKRPKLLFLIRLAPYPFNVMNCLLAASPSLSLRTYTICTALSLFKLIIHTSIGSSIHSFAEYHVKDPNHSQADESMLGHYSTIVGIVLCIAIFVYLSYVARKAVDDELGYGPLNREETEAFLPEGDSEDQDLSRTRDLMVELPYIPHRQSPSSSSSRPWSRTTPPPTRPGPLRLESSCDRFELAGHEEAAIGL